MIKHITGQPFIFATGLAALIHSTWSLGTLFAGTEPPQWTGAWFAWVIPAALIAFSLDVGQIVTSSEIRAGQRSRAKYATFVVFGVATYYLQWLYIAHHMPDLALSAGVRADWTPIAGLIRDAAIWFIPALLPLSTTLYTFSHMEVNTPPSIEAPTKVPTPAIIVESPSCEPDAALPDLAGVPTSQALPPGHVEESSDRDGESRRYSYTCADCGFTNTYSSMAGAAQGQRAHARHCPARVDRPAVTRESAE